MVLQPAVQSEHQRTRGAAERGYLPVGEEVENGPRDGCFNYVVPDAAGKINLRFSSGWEPANRPTWRWSRQSKSCRRTGRRSGSTAAPTPEFVDWNGSSGTPIRSSGRPDDQVLAWPWPTLRRPCTIRSLYQTARTGKNFSYAFAVPAGLYNVHLKFAELWLEKVGMRPMNIDINGRRFWENWDPSAQAGRLGMSADIRAEDIVPDKDGKITINVSAAGANDAILQGVEIE